MESFPQLRKDFELPVVAGVWRSEGGVGGVGGGGKAGGKRGKESKRSCFILSVWGGVAEKRRWD